MITAVDTNILIYLFRTDSPYHQDSRLLLTRAHDQGDVLVCDIVYAELAPQFADQELLDTALRELGVTVSPIDSAVAYDAGRRWKRYRDAGGPRKRIMTDFLIGAHAVARADAFLTRDRGFFATYFPELGIGEVV